MDNAIVLHLIIIISSSASRVLFFPYIHIASVARCWQD